MFWFGFGSLFSFVLPCLCPFLCDAVDLKYFSLVPVILSVISVCVYSLVKLFHVLTLFLYISLAIIAFSSSSIHRCSPLSNLYPAKVTSKS